MTPIPYTLIRSDRKSIGIQITADGVVVRAPKRLSAAGAAALARATSISTAC